jgi:hypothetical protein
MSLVLKDQSKLKCNLAARFRSFSELPESHHLVPVHLNEDGIDVRQPLFLVFVNVGESPCPPPNCSDCELDVEAAPLTDV